MTRIPQKNILLLTVFATVCVVILGISWYLSDEAQEEKEIYSAFVHQTWGNSLPEDNVAFYSFVGQCEVALSSTHLYIPPEIPDETFQDFVSSNGKFSRALNLESWEQGLAVVSWESTKVISSANCVGIIPEGKTLVGLSRVGFNSDKTDAVLCVIGASASHRTEMFIRLARHNGDWEIND